MVTVDEWRTACSPDALCIVDALRDAVMVANSNLEETIKWNAPSFAQHGRDRITLGLDRSGVRESCCIAALSHATMVLYFMTQTVWHAGRRPIGV